MSDMENLGLLRPPRLEDAGLEDCALPPASIHEAFLKAASVVGSRLTGSDDRDCVADPWTEVLSPPSDALIGIESETGVPGPCGVEKGGDGEAASDLGGGGLNEGETGKKDDVVVVGGGGGGGEVGDCVDGMRGLKIKDKDDDDADDDEKKKPTLVEGYF